MAGVSREIGIGKIVTDQPKIHRAAAYAKPIKVSMMNASCIMAGFNCDDDARGS
jgi:hypothetical protein